MFFYHFFMLFDLQDFKFQYVNCKAFGASFLYWVEFKISIQDLWGKSANVNNYSSLFASHSFHKLYTIQALSDTPTKAPAIK